MKSVAFPDFEEVDPCAGSGGSVKVLGVGVLGFRVQGLGLRGNEKG